AAGRSGGDSSGKRADAAVALVEEDASAESQRNGSAAGARHPDGTRQRRSSQPADGPKTAEQDGAEDGQAASKSSRSSRRNRPGAARLSATAVDDTKASGSGRTAAAGRKGADGGPAGTTHEDNGADIAADGSFANPAQDGADIEVDLDVDAELVDLAELVDDSDDVISELESGEAEADVADPASPDAGDDADGTAVAIADVGAGKPAAPDVPGRQGKAAGEEGEDEAFVYGDDDEDLPAAQVAVAGATSDPVKDYLKQIGKVPLLNAEQ